MGVEADRLMGEAGNVYMMAAGHYPLKPSYLSGCLDAIYFDCFDLVAQVRDEGKMSGSVGNVGGKFDEATARDMLGCVAAIVESNGDVPLKVWKHFRRVMKMLGCSGV